ncbi:hypothetical protein Tco_0110949 [Tanacetum coccineum]
MVDEFAPPNFFASIRGIDHDQLFTEFNVGAARQVSLSAEVRMRAEYNIKEKRKLKTVVDEHVDLLKVREGEIESLRAQLLLKGAKAAKAIRLRVEFSGFAAMKKSVRDEVNALNGRNLILEKERDALDVKVTDLETVIVRKERELSDSNAQLTCIKSHNDNLTNQVHELETSSAGLQEKVTTYENCMEQLGKFQNERMKIVSDKLEKLDTDLVEMALHLEENFYPHLLLSLPAVVRPLRKACKIGWLPGLLMVRKSVNFSLLAELKYNKDASVETIMKILRLEESLAERLDVSSSRVWRIKENIAHHRSALRDVFIPLSEPLSITALTGTKGTSEFMPVTTAITTALSVTSASASFIYPISTDGYEVALVKKVSVEAGFRPGLLTCMRPFPVLTLPHTYLSIFALLFASRIAAYSLHSSSRSRLISRASLFSSKLTSAVLSVGMLISARMTASVSYVNKNGVSPLLDFIIVQCAHRK